jgi:chemotaxis protein methyltransferase CheR
MPTDPILPLGVFLLLRDVIHERLGVWFEEDKRDLLAGKLADRVSARRLRSFLEYFFLLKYGQGADDEWPHLTDALSVQETYFWREFEQIRALVDILVPKHQADHLGTIRIWSAACATGEEPLTIAMALNEAGWFDRAEIEIWASDVSPAALEKTARGEYRERSFRALPAGLRAKYFTQVAGGWRVDPALQARVRFLRANVLEPAEIAALATSRYIFCRNVFIYFSPNTINRVVGCFASRMPRPSYLFVGAAESLLRMRTPFVLEEVGGAFTYVLR